MGSERQRPLSRGSVVVVAALGLVLWIATACYVYYFNLQSTQCQQTDGGRCGLGLVGLFSTLIGLVIISTAVGAFAALAALGVALDARDRGSAASLGVLLVAAAIAVYTLLQNGHPGHPLVTALYGFPPDGLSLHPLAYYGSAALVVALPLLVLPFALTQGRAQRVSAAAAPLLVVVFWIAIRLAG
jgi:hypothetical protein